MDILKNNEIPTNQWNELEACSSTASYFQTKKCYDFYNTLNFAKGFAFAVQNEGKLKALVCGYIMADGGTLKQLFSKRAIIPGGVMLHPECSISELAQLLATTRMGIKSKAIYTEMRNYFDYSAYKTVFEENGFAYQAHLNFHLDSSDYDLAFKNLKQNKRRYIRLSLKEGAEWHTTKDLDEITELYNILEQLYKTKVKTPLFPFSFFKQLSKETNSIFIVVKYLNKVIGGSIFVVCANKTMYEWFVCGEDQKFKNIYPSILATWGGIEYATKNNLPLFDFMGAGKPEVEYGVRDFKAEFGGNLVEHGRFLCINNKLAYKLGSWFINYIKKSNTPKSINDKKTNNNITIESNINNIDREEWRDFVQKHPNGNIFQSPEMYDIVSNTPKMQPVICIIKENGKITGCLLTQLQKQHEGLLGKLSARAIITGGPLVINNNQKTTKLLLVELNKLISTKVIYTQFRNQFDVLNLNEVFQTENFKFESHLNILIDLSKDKETLWKEISDGRRKKISTAIKFGFIVEVFENDMNDDTVLDCYKIIQKIYKNAELPLTDIKILQNAAKSNQLILITLKHNDIIVGCRFILKFKTYLYGWYAGSNQKFYQQFPNDLLIWETIKWGCENGYKTFDYGGAGNPNIKYGVRNFKLQSGGYLVNYGRYEKRHKPISYQIAKLGLIFWKLINRTTKNHQS